MQRYDFDWTAYGSITHGSAGDPTGFTPGTVLRTQTSVFRAPTNTPADALLDDGNGYWNPSSPALRSLVACQAVTGSPNGAVSEFSYDGNGNFTQERDWDSTKQASQPVCSGTAQLGTSNAVVLNRGPYVQGNVMALTDGNGNQTQYTYDSQNLYLTTLCEACGTLPRSTSYVFDPNTGRLQSQTDYNGLTRSYTYDNLGRQTVLQESGALGNGATGLLRKTTTTYEDVNRRVVTTTDRVAPGDQQLISVVDYDQLGRQRLTRQLESTAGVDDDAVGIKVQTRYGYVNNAGTSPPSHLTYQMVSNPYRAGTSSAAASEQTMGWRVTATDSVRGFSSVAVTTAATVPTGIACPVSGQATGRAVTCVAGNVATVTDEAGVQRSNTVDGLGRLTQVVENGLPALTNYSYDVLGNLTGVTHAGFGTGCATPQGTNVNHRYLLNLRDEVLPKSPAGAAVRYALNQWAALTRFLEDGELEIDNGATERANRDIAIGRGNWTFFGSDQGGRTAAVLRTFIASCKRCGVEPFAWFSDVLSRIADHPVHQLNELLPHNWKSLTPATQA